MKYINIIRHSAIVEPKATYDWTIKITTYVEDVKIKTYIRQTTPSNYLHEYLCNLIIPKKLCFV